MKKAWQRVAIALVVVFVFAPFVAQADTVTALRMQLQTVLTRIAELKAELAALESGVQLGSGGACVQLSKSLYKGMDNAEVRKLQVFLAQDPSIYPERITSGYFGTLTERAVQRWQARHGIVAYGTPSTTGYGAVGPRTRAAIAAACGQGTGGTGTGTGGTNPDKVISFNFSTSGGKAPYRATAEITTLDRCGTYTINWGDNSQPVTTSSSDCDNSTQVAPATLRVNHTYTKADSYTATLYAGTASDITTLPQITTASIAITQGDPYIKLLSPNGGETLRLGDRASLRWEVANYPEDSAVALYIINQYHETYKVALRKTEPGVFDWMVGNGVCDANGCDVQLSPGAGYKMRAVLYTPANACIIGCNANSVEPTFLARDESDKTFTVANIGASGSTPLTVHDDSGKAPFTPSMTVKIAPLAGAVAGNFEIDFGDGSGTYKVHVPAGETEVTERTFSHTYPYAGTYKVRLRPIGGMQHIAEATVRVSEPEFRITPKARVYAPVTVKATFDVDNTCSHSGDITRVYTVDWGDNTETSRHEVTVPRCARGEKPQQSISSYTLTHDYTTAGTYTPTLTVRAGDAPEYSVRKSVSVESPTLQVSPNFGFKPLTVKAQFTADESCVMGQSVTQTYTVDWGDGTAKTTEDVTLQSCGGDFSLNIADKEFSHVYQELGRYTVRLTVRKSSIGSSYSRTAQVVVDKSVLRNGVRKLASTINNLEIGENVATALRSIFR